MCEDVGVIHLLYVRCILSQHSHPGPYWLHLHRLQGKCWQVLPKETYNSISGFPALFPFLQDLPGQGIKDRIHQPELSSTTGIFCKLKFFKICWWPALQFLQSYQRDVHKARIRKLGPTVGGKLLAHREEKNSCPVPKTTHVFTTDEKKTFLKLHSH